MPEHDTEARLAAIRELHQPCTYDGCVCGGSCQECDGLEYPCKTIRALDGEVPE